ncbi:uncharacterized protein LOC113009064 isoform X1 [Astatotilapia calliptera]|uniref:uncharacterized protein LOC113009064 isoform X1 n=1 Tax=Astatotilapia calliptera TaxID=8154 RepID=UPI000E41F96C|nr:suppressor APC domain-containing protein 1 isoform X1 [Astatotilapia calliptera]
MDCEETGDVLTREVGHVVATKTRLLERSQELQTTMIQIYWKLHCWVGTASLKTHQLLHPSLVGSFIRKMVMADPEPVTTTKIKRLKDLEKEKDALWSGLEILEKARLWYLQRLEENRAWQDSIESRSGFVSRNEDGAEARSCLLGSRIQRVNGSLGSVMSEPNAMTGSNPSLLEAVADSDLRWHNSVLTQEVKNKNCQISLLEQEKHALLNQLHALKNC